MSIRTLFSARRPIDRPIEKVIDYYATDEKRLLAEIEEYEVTDNVERCFRKFLDTFGDGVRSGQVTEIGVWVEANRHSVTVRADLAEGLPAVMVDRVQLQQVLLNLMLNGIEAIRDTSGELSIKSQLAEDGQLLISVTDTGMGLPTENVDQIFNPFFTTKYKGTGLGLAITRSIVESRGGRIWATPNSGPGATFYFTLPSRRAVPA